jgi:hypothetical protein
MDKKNLNMILDQSKVSTHNRGLGFDSYAHHTRHPPTVLGVARRGEILIETEPKNTVFKSAGIMSSLNASSSKFNVVHAKPSVDAKPSISKSSTSQTCREKYTCSFLEKMDIWFVFVLDLPTNRKRKEKLLLQNDIGKNRVLIRGARLDRHCPVGQTGQRSDCS